MSEESTRERAEREKEWRDIILKKIDHIELAQEQIKRDINDMKIQATSPDIIEKMQERIRILESFRDKALTLFFVIQGLGGVVMIILNHYWK